MEGSTSAQLRPEPLAIRVLLLDASPITRSGLRAVLQARAGVEVVAEAGDQCEAAELVAQTSPHVVVVNTIKSLADAAAALRQVSTWKGKVLALVCDGPCGSDAVDLIAKEADGTLLRNADVDDLVAALRMLVAGYSLHPAAVPSSIARGPEVGGAAPALGDPCVQHALTPRENDVLRLLGRGRTNAEISTQLTLSESTVKSHVQNLLAKLGLRNRVEAALHAVEVGLIDTQR